MALTFWSRALLSLTFAQVAFAALVAYSDCTSSSFNNTQTGVDVLQWVTYHADAIFDPRPPYNLTITIRGNITGNFEGNGSLPSLNDTSYWSNPKETSGKIIDIGPNTDSYATLFASWDVASTEIQSQPQQDFCNVTTGCPLVPSNTWDRLPAFNLSQNMEAGYGFATINAQFYVKAGDPDFNHVVCVSVDVTPYIGNTPASLVRYLPVLVLVLVAVATASAVFSPWGTWNIYHWTSNYGRDADQLRLITPGFGDCLGYIQFVVLSGSLSLVYPGFFQPVVSQVAWSTLMFNQSFVSHDPGINPIADGVYSLNRNTSTTLDDMDTMRQLVGMGTDNDIWAGFMVWLLVIIGVMIALIQMGTLFRILFLYATRTQEEDLRNKNWPFTVGNVIRVVFNYFFLPLVTFCIFQMYVAARLDGDPAYLVALASVTLVILLCFAGWLLYQILSTNPRSFLFDDLPTNLLYGPLYNTYSDDAAPFALVPILVNVVRGIAIGGLQVSGIAQIIILAIAEIILLLTLNAFRPFSSPTSMNLYQTAFSIVRIIIILLMVAFVPGLNTSDSIKSWIGYVILFLHAVTVFVGFFLHSLQTLIEVVARALGAGAGGEGTQATRGGLVKVFGVRQLSRRNPRASGRARGSMASEAAMLNQDMDQDKNSFRQDGTRSRSMSASSAFLLNSRVAGSNRHSLALDTLSQSGALEHAPSSIGHTPGTPSGAPSVLSYTPGQSQAGFDRRSGMASMAASGHAHTKSQDPADPFFRPPRQRRNTNDLLASPRTRSGGSWHSSDWAKRNSGPDSEDADNLSEGPLRDSAGTPTPAYLGNNRIRAESAPEDPNTPKPDYATREVDYYYGVRGPALSDQPTRKLKTGPADPTGPVSSATGWFRNIFGNKTKDKHKGFEVVRGRGIKQAMEPVPTEDAEMSPQESYRDEYQDESGSGPRTAVPTTTAPRKLDLEDEADAIGAGTRRIPGEERPDGADDLGITNPSKDAPVLPEIEAGESIHIPSRIGSRASRQPGNSVRYKGEEAPTLPRHRSNRSVALAPASALTAEPVDEERPPMPTIDQSPAATPEKPKQIASLVAQSGGPSGLSRMPFGSLGSSSEDTAAEALGDLSRRHHVRAISGISDMSVDDPTRSIYQTPPSPIRDPDARRGSIGYVNQHRASDNIVTPPHVLGGSTAELVDDSSVAPTDRSRGATPEIRGAPHINF